MFGTHILYLGLAAFQSTDKVEEEPLGTHREPTTEMTEQITKPDAAIV